MKQLEIKKTLIRSKKLKLEKLLDLYLSDDMPKTDYIARKTKLEAEMNGYNSEIAELETELKANDAITSNNNQL
ncbi:MAG: hypothetical protein QF704_11390, partial [Anaerolineales bacterium]|nr:hypothetical protein [Anaerolineales bacterium]